MKRKKWFVFFTSDSYCESPNYYPTEQFDWAVQLESFSNEIAEEVHKIIDTHSGSFQPYFIESLSGKDGWRTFSFKTWGIDVKKALKAANTINSIANQFPQIVSISINLLPAGTKIAPHHGDSNTFFRVHMGIQIPCGLPECGFKVNGEEKAWENGKLLIFNDANRHEAWNNSEQDRIIVVFDILRKEYLKEAVLITTKVRSILILQLLFTKFSKLKQLPKWILRILRFEIQLLLLLIYPIQLFTGVIKKHN